MRRREGNGDVKGEWGKVWVYRFNGKDLRVLRKNYLKIALKNI